MGALNELEIAAAGAAQPSAAFALKKVLDEAIVDATIYICSDSTGVYAPSIGTPYWPYKVATYLAQKYPNHTVEFYYNATALAGWGTKITVQSGGNGRTLRIYNAAVAGTNAYYDQGSRFEAVVGLQTGITADLVILNHGKNGDTNPVAEIQSAMYQANLAKIIARQPRAGVMICAQYPNQGNNQQDTKARGARLAATLMGAELLDFYSAFLAAGNNLDLYDGAGSVHASDKGDDLAFGVFKRAFDRATQPMDPPVVGLNERRPSLLLNSDFSAFSGSVPDSWTATNATCTKDASIYETAGGSLDLTNTASGAGYVTQTISGDAFKRLAGKFVTLSARVYVPTGTTASQAGLIEIVNGQPLTWRNGGYVQSSGGKGGWFWVAVSGYIRATDTSVTINLYALFGSGSSGVNVKFDRVCLVEGLRPYDVT